MVGGRYEDLIIPMGAEYSDPAGDLGVRGGIVVEGLAGWGC